MLDIKKIIIIIDNMKELKIRIVNPKVINYINELHNKNGSSFNVIINNLLNDAVNNSDYNNTLKAIEQKVDFNNENYNKIMLTLNKFVDTMSKKNKKEKSTRPGILELYKNNVPTSEIHKIYPELSENDIVDFISENSDFKEEA